MYIYIYIYIYVYIYVYVYIYIYIELTRNALERSLPDYEPGTSRAHWKHFVCGAAGGVCVQVRVTLSIYLSIFNCLPPRDTSPHQDSTGTAPSGTPPPAQPPPPPQTWGTQSHSAPTLLERPISFSSLCIYLPTYISTHLPPAFAWR